MKLLEFFTESKSGEPNLNEDGVYFNPPFAAVIDGTTSKTGKTFNGVLGGRFAMDCIIAALNRISPTLAPFEMITAINEALKAEIQRFGHEYGPSAGIVLYNDIRKELILYGDNPYAINGISYFSKKESDVLAAEKRAQIIKNLKASGMSIEELQKNDIGRKEIVSFLQDVSLNYANVDGPGGFPVISGQNIVASFIQVHKITAGSEIILASDGYPRLFDTLSKTELYLKEMLEKDVLCIEELKGTKGVSLGNVSFDDRTYLRFLT